jgi:hypothetical protein
MADEQPPLADGLLEASQSQKRMTPLGNHDFGRATVTRDAHPTLAPHSAKKHSERWLARLRDALLEFARGLGNRVAAIVSNSAILSSILKPTTPQGLDQVNVLLLLFVDLVLDPLRWRGVHRARPLIRIGALH